MLISIDSRSRLVEGDVLDLFMRRIRAQCQDKAVHDLEHIARSAETVSSTENLTNHRSVANFDTQSLLYGISMSANSSLSISRTQDLRFVLQRAEGELHAQKDWQAL